MTFFITKLHFYVRVIIINKIHVLQLYNPHHPLNCTINFIGILEEGERGKSKKSYISSSVFYIYDMMILLHLKLNISEKLYVCSLNLDQIHVSFAYI